MAATCSRWCTGRRGARRGRAAPWGRPRWCWRTPRAPSSAPGISARSTRAWSTSAPTCRRSPLREPDRPTILTVGHLVARKRHADVLRAMWLLRDDHPDLRWVVVGDGPERPALERMAEELELTRRVDFKGELPPDEVRRPATVFALPSVDEAFGVAYVEAMAAGIPAIGCRGEAGPEEIRASGGGHPARRPRRPREPRRRAAAPARGRRLAARARRGRARDRRARVHVGGVRPRDRRRLPRGAAVKPVLFVTNHAPPFRVGAFAKLHEREDVVFALIGGDVRHGGGAGGPATCRSRSSARGSTRSRGSPPATTARSWRACPAAWRRSPPTWGRGGPACRSSCGRACGRTRARSRTPPPTWWCATCTGTPTRSSPTGPTSPRTCASKAQATRSSRPHRASTTSIGTDNRPRIGARPSRRRLWDESRGKKDLKCSSRPGVSRACRHSAPRWFWSAAVRSEPGPSPPARSCP